MELTTKASKTMTTNKMITCWALVLTAFVLVGMTTPHAFAPGTTILSSEVNANFQAIETAVTALEDRLNAPGNIVGMARVIGNGTLARSWMANGGTVTSVRTGVGTYEVTFPGESVSANTRPIFAAVVGSGSGWATVSSSGGAVRIYTYNTAGAAADDAFWVMIPGDIP